ncbi:50S ribosomal protein L18 [Candidatus Falkowbacteria bacterium RIFOXYD2_FULL_35_9]|uniref:Large ribosomal subunit protein uL18 n=1 Tax=Candidatus Falkowbacteria bacterium RIFOXYC2_FULL_36_12 TaxID=1798002 RepID=A0A1F5SW55_9BACT|nr:MAG: 50S ribosomal protein L18 [Candidatus Falkowbacteria bacterium RIFOXYB2_FULL_35_7]OGF30967.1 MAG: 50S ribosomal protein L18 [Candidatus Falkowbacteria bacterium RIFOXYC2_FULL_36_12]OGF34395.1 MAG: 50S ribosomal protein L18 [Candidatus Falkowbacteria bacterium RIFOXYA2_FULL_35_8]OGF47291.1 MAG: 50S ribosomal protein L18 [Candidatus Falkowbacteria bacterium RIFOXYD2_FULL_35_9]
MNITKNKLQSALRRKNRVRAKINGTVQKPRAAIFRSSKHFYIQLVDDTTGTTLVSAKSGELKVKAGELKPVEKAAAVGKLVAERALEKGIKEVVFDRNRFKYHGRVKAAADGMREAGLKF